jgi:hypothetical protein
MANCFEALVQAFHLGFIFRPENAIAGRWSLFTLAPGGQDFTPILPVRDTVDEGVPGVASQVTQEAVAGVQISGKHQDETGVVEEGDPNN